MKEVFMPSMDELYIMQDKDTMKIIQKSENNTNSDY